ncbi:MAG: adenylosuccinate synthase [Chloroflexi bacterium]|nr:adenylosuccinate synthase [Chloroflexota bacterium]
MPVVVIIGGQWGDEGKGKIVDLLAEKACYTVRFSGGDNAGHTVVNQFGEFKLHLTPSGIFHQTCTAVIGNGAAVNPAVLLRELSELKRSGVDTSHLLISRRAHVIMPYHILFDRLEEKGRGEQAIGTTQKGIGPAFADKVARLGIRVGDLLDHDVFYRRLKQVIEHKNTILTKVYGAEPLSVDEVYRTYIEYGKELEPFVQDTEVIIADAIRAGKMVLLEGAQGSLLDPDFGTYPYVTSSSPTIGGAILGSGIAPAAITACLGVFKAYATRVGSGPMPTELKDETGDFIRKRAQEYGATTGRPRRCGWFDAVAGRFTTCINGFTGIALTRLDVLDVLPAIKVCVAYELQGQRLKHFPSNSETLSRCQPVYEEFQGWLAPTSGIRRLADLPLKAKRYVEGLEELLGCRMDIISVGASREQTIMVR